LFYSELSTEALFSPITFRTGKHQVIRADYGHFAFTLQIDVFSQEQQFRTDFILDFIQQQRTVEPMEQRKMQMSLN